MRDNNWNKILLQTSKEYDDLHDLLDSILKESKKFDADIINNEYIEFKIKPTYFSFVLHGASPARFCKGLITTDGLSNRNPIIELVYPSFSKALIILGSIIIIFAGIYGNLLTDIAFLIVSLLAILLFSGLMKLLSMIGVGIFKGELVNEIDP